MYIILIINIVGVIIFLIFRSIRRKSTSSEIDKLRKQIDNGEYQEALSRARFLCTDRDDDYIGDLFYQAESLVQVINEIYKKVGINVDEIISKIDNSLSQIRRHQEKLKKLDQTQRQTEGHMFVSIDLDKRNEAINKLNKFFDSTLIPEIERFKKLFWQLPKIPTN